MERRVPGASSGVPIPPPARGVKVEATVKEVLPHLLFQVELEDGRQVLAHSAESFRMSVVRVLPGDKVTLELSPFDGSRGRIVSREGRR
jgi:translation initiation factor IF-1